MYLGLVMHYSVTSLAAILTLTAFHVYAQKEQNQTHWAICLGFCTLSANSIHQKALPSKHINTLKSASPTHPAYPPIHPPCSSHNTWQVDTWQHAFLQDQPTSWPVLKSYCVNQLLWQPAVQLASNCDPLLNQLVGTVCFHSSDIVHLFSV